MNFLNREQRERYEQGETDIQTFAVFAPFEVKFSMNTSFEFFEPRTTRRVRTNTSGYSVYFSPLSRRNRFGATGDTPFLFAVFAPFAVRNRTDTPFEFYEPRTQRRVRTRRSRPDKLFAAFACFAVKNTGDTPFFVRGFRAFRG